jgi:hypothetical protein
MKYGPAAAAALAAFALAATVAACSSSSSSSAPAGIAADQKPAAAAGSATGAAQPALWGDMKPIVSVKELMRDMIDPASDLVFDAIAVEKTKSGEIQHEPKTDEDWQRLRTGAVTMGEGIYLLKVPRPFTPPGEENNINGPDREELSAAEILAKVQANPVQWNARIEALRNVSLQVLQIVEKKKTDELWDASDNLDTACENCHVDFWYPYEGEYLKKLDKKLDDLFGDQMKPMGSRAPIPSSGK